MPSTPITLPVAEWTPDMPAFQGGSQNMRNVLPRTPTSYGPLSNIQTYSGPLMRRICMRFQTERPVSGSLTSFATALMNFSSVCEPEALRKPRPLPSELM